MNELKNNLKYESIKDKKIIGLFDEAQDYLNNGKYIEALFCCDKILMIGSHIDDNSIEYKAYMGMYLIWVNYCKKIKQNSALLGDFFGNVLHNAKEYASEEEVDRYFNIFTKNSKILNSIDK